MEVHLGCGSFEVWRLYTTYTYLEGIYRLTYELTLVVYKYPCLPPQLNVHLTHLGSDMGVSHNGGIPSQNQQHLMSCVFLETKRKDGTPTKRQPHVQVCPKSYGSTKTWLVSFSHEYPVLACPQGRGQWWNPGRLCKWVSFGKTDGTIK